MERAGVLADAREDHVAEPCEEEVDVVDREVAEDPASAFVRKSSRSTDVQGDGRSGEVRVPPEDAPRGIVAFDHPAGEDAALVTESVDKQQGFGVGRGQGLLDQGVESVRQAGQGDLDVRGVGRGDDGAVGSDRGDEGAQVGRGGDPVLRFQGSAPGGVAFEDAHQPQVPRAPRGTEVVHAHAPRADQDQARC